MSIFSRTGLWATALTLASLQLFSPLAQAADYGGIALGATRVIYPQGSEQISLSVNNTDGQGVFLIQSWVENADSKKSSDFVVTPPLFAMQGKKENTLRILDASNNQLPQDRESLFWMNVKAIPAATKESPNKNTLQIAVLNRIKLFVRPKGLNMPPADAPAKLRFHQTGSQLTIKNPTPYYVTLVELTEGSTALPATMVPPLGQSSLVMPSTAHGDISFQTVNDYGANTPKQHAVMD